jgi:hypothetical protein
VLIDPTRSHQTKINCPVQVRREQPPD